MSKLTEAQETKLGHMINDIKSGLFEDFQFVDEEQAQQAINRLKAHVDRLKASEYVDNDN